MRSIFNRFAELLNNRAGRWFDIGWIALLMIYVLAGVSITTFHGDEVTHVYNSQDFVTAFIDGDIGSLRVEYRRESERAFLRLLDSSVSRYTIGLAWYLAGRSPDELPQGVYLRALSYEDNLSPEWKRRPTDEVMQAGRMASAVFLAGSVAVMFALGWQYGGRPMALLVSALYTLNPIVLLNGRRAMQEGSLLFFGLLTILIGVIIARRRAEIAREKRERAQHPPADDVAPPEPIRGLHWGWWVALIVAGGLTLASKNSGVLYIGGAFGWIFLGDLWREFPRNLLKTIRLGFWLVACGVLSIAVYVAASPGMWSDPPARLYDVAYLRANEFDRLIAGEPNAPTRISWRVENLFVQPYIAPVRHFESRFWLDVPEVMDQIDTYESSVLQGVDYGLVLGIPLTLLAVFGGVSLLLPRLRPPVPVELYVGLPVWMAAVVVTLLVNPLPWQRYYLPFIPGVTLLTAIGIYALYRVVQLRGAALPRHGEDTRYAAAILIVTLLGSLFVYGYFESREPFPQTLERQIRMAQADGSTVPTYRAIITMRGLTEPLVIRQVVLRVDEVGSDYFCVKPVREATRVCYPYANVIRVYETTSPTP